jgi:hypothetical protein
MPTKLVVIVVRVVTAVFVVAVGLISAAGDASAVTHTQQAHARGPQISESASHGHFESYANGRQSYENPDRELYVWGD